MICELCGKYIKKGFDVRLEGGVVTACPDCSKHGEIVKPQTGKKEKKKTGKFVKKEEFKLEAKEELVEEYPKKIKNAREKKGLKQDELARLINEPASIIHRIESGRMEPSPKIAYKIQRKLGVKILSPHKEEMMVKKKGEKSKPLTLGDMVVLKRRK